jgi:hypothetical protein
MMKRLIVFVLVLAMASVGWASNVKISGPSTAMPGDTISLSIVTLTGFTAYEVALGKISVNGAGGHVTHNIDGSQPIATFHAKLVTIPDVGYIASYYEMGSDGEIVYVYASVDAGQSIAGPATLYTWSYTVSSSASGTITISHDPTFDTSFKGVRAQGASDYYSPDSLDIDIIPEPMTILLLGLGSLFLRRRR